MHDLFIAMRAALCEFQRVLRHQRGLRCERDERNQEPLPF